MILSKLVEISKDVNSFIVFLKLNKIFKANDYFYNKKTKLWYYSFISSNGSKYEITINYNKIKSSIKACFSNILIPEPLLYSKDFDILELNQIKNINNTINGIFLKYILNEFKVCDNNIRFICKINHIIDEKLILKTLLEYDYPEDTKFLKK